jgi:phosphohistidine phosphatase
MSGRMELYVFRHGFSPVHTGADFHRELDATGSAEVISSAELLSGIAFDLLLCSPLVRALQTAELISQTLGFERPVQVCPDASPDGKLAVLLDRLAAIQAERVILVSHQPMVSNLVEYLTTERVFMGTAAVLGLRMDIVDASCGEIFYRGLR